MLKWWEALGAARGMCGLWPVGRFQHLPALPHGHTAVIGLPGQKNLSHNQKDPTTSIRKTHTDTRPGNWLPRGWRNMAPPHHTEPEGGEASAVSWGVGGVQEGRQPGDGPSQETLVPKDSAKSGPP